MNQLYSVFIVFFIFLFSGCTAQNPTEIKEQLVVKNCYLADFSKHEKNQKLLKEVLEEELGSLDARKSVNKADYLSQRISQIALNLCAKGFSIDAYQVPTIDEDSVVSYDCFVLWEGKDNSIPLTFFIYIWPSVEFAQQYYSDSWNDSYKSIIHSHPIPCAFALLQGTLVQRNYELIDPALRVVKLVNEEIFQKFDASVDDLNTPFIHQMYSKGGEDAFAISLHAYGLPSETEVMDTFTENDPLHTYTDIEEVE